MKRKIRFLFVDEHTALMLLTGKARITNLPDEVSFERVFYDYERRGFGIMVEHESFGIVEPGVIPPVFMAEVEMND
jgi:hypothetical protein